MTDGPFRNAPLSRRWKRYGEDLVSDAASLEERTTQACHSMLGDLDISAISSLIGDLETYGRRVQMDLDPLGSIDAIFDSHPKSLLADTIQKHLTVNLQDRLSPVAALDQALASSATDWISTAKNRLDEECIRARDLGDMSREDFAKGIERNHDAFAAIHPGDLCAALISGNSRTFNHATKKNDGVDDGPSE